MKTLILLLASLAPARSATPEKPASPYSACAKVSGGGKWIARRKKLEQERAALEGAIAKASPVRCGKGLPMPEMHAKVQAFAISVHEQTVQARALKARSGTHSPCAKALDGFLSSQQQEQRQLYEKVEALCR